MFKLQSGIEKFFLSTLVIIVAIVISYFIYKSFYSVISHSSIKSYLTQASFDNIYGNKTSIFVLLKNETNVGTNVIISEMITFNNGTSKTYKVPFALQMASKSGNGFLYDFATTNFPAISNDSQPIKISNVFIISGNYIIESENSSITYSSYYYTKSSIENIPLYYLNMSATPLNAGNLIPGNGYYYAGSKVAISEKPNIGYAFSGWYGFGNGNYTGPNKTALIEMNSNITEYAKYVKLVKIYVNATYNGIPVYVNSALNATTNGTVYLMPGVKYTLSFPMYASLNSGTRYVFERMSDDCGISISPNSNSTTFVPSYANYNCKFIANYVEQYYLSMSSNNVSMGTVSPSSGWYDKGDSIEIIATPKPSSYFFSSFLYWKGSGVGSYSGTNNQTTITINNPISEEAYFKKFVPFLFITIFNNEPVATPAPFQQMITFNPSLYSKYENSNLGNIRFYQGSTELYSWCESGCSNSSSNAIFWIKLPNGINANSKVIINMTFKPLATNYDGVYAGEAPQLSSTYAEYDNGAKVFNFYDNFAGTGLNTSKWIANLNDGTLIINNGLTLYMLVLWSSYPAYVSSVQTFDPQKEILDFYGYFYNYSYYVDRIGYFGSQSGGVPQYEITTYYYNYVLYESYMGYTETLMRGGSFSTCNVFSLWSGTRGIYGQVNYGSVYNVTGYNPYLPPFIPSTSQYIVILAYGSYIATHGSYYPYYDPVYVQWIRTRTLPPNGVMPIVSLGKIQKS